MPLVDAILHTVARYAARYETALGQHDLAVRVALALARADIVGRGGALAHEVTNFVAERARLVGTERATRRLGCRRGLSGLVGVGEALRVKGFHERLCHRADDRGEIFLLDGEDSGCGRRRG
jgi:hypothetical protein